MYNATPGVAALWRELLEGVSAKSGVGLDVIDYPAPAPLSDLWRREDMGCVFMCGWPFRRSDPRPRIIAAPVPEPDYCSGPNYCSVMAVQNDSSCRSLQDTFGGRIAWTDEGSHSGFNAPRKLLLSHRKNGESLYRESIGPVITPRASINTVIEGRADVAPVDSYFFQLLKRHEPETVAKVRVVAQTECAPIPVLVAARGVPCETVTALRNALTSAGDDPDFAPLLHRLCLTGFAAIDDPERYAVTEDWDRAARAAGYLRPS